jgi:hypothetical protein
MGKEICIMGLFYTNPTKDRPWTGIRLTIPLLIKQKGLKGGGVCVCICLFGFMCRCAQTAIGRPFSTCEKGKKHPRLRLILFDSTKIDPKGRHHPGRPGLRSYREAEGRRTHTHTPRAMWAKGGEVFFHW